MKRSMIFTRRLFVATAILCAVVFASCASNNVAMQTGKEIIPVISASCIAINPVNWRTDDIPATLNGTITVTLSPEHHVLVVAGYDGSEYRPYRNFLNVGDIHSCEPWLYSECLEKNIAIRAKKWRER